MEGARALLDSLMGQTRDVPLKEAKKKKGQNFKESNVCKFYLLGFCPQYEEIFKNTKKGHLQIGDCEKIHSDALKEEFEAHPDRVDYEIRYSRDLLRFLESLIRKVDEAVARQSIKIDEDNQSILENGIGELAKREIAAVKEQASTYLREAEDAAQRGDVEDSKLKRTAYEQTLKRAEEYEEKAKEPRMREICEVCGLRPEKGTIQEGESVLLYSHTQGRIHIGFVKIREWVKNLKERLDALEKERLKNGERDRKKEDFEREDGSRRERVRDGGRRDDFKNGERERKKEDFEREDCSKRERDRDGGRRDDFRNGERERRKEDFERDDGSKRERDRDGGRRDDRDRNRGHQSNRNDYWRDDRGRGRDYGDRDGYQREDRGRDRNYDDRDYPRDDHGYDRRGTRGRDSERGHDVGNRGRDNDRGYDDGYDDGRSRSGMRRTGAR